MGEWMWVATNFCLCTVNLTTLRKTAKRQPSEWKRMSLELNEKIHAICQNNWFTGRVSNLVVRNTKHKSYDHSDKWTVSITVVFVVLAVTQSRRTTTTPTTFTFLTECVSPVPTHNLLELDWTAPWEKAQGHRFSGFRSSRIHKKTVKATQVAQQLITIISVGPTCTLSLSTCPPADGENPGFRDLLFFLTTSRCKNCTDCRQKHYV